MQSNNQSCYGIEQVAAHILAVVAVARNSPAEEHPVDSIAAVGVVLGSGIDIEEEIVGSNSAVELRRTLFGYHQQLRLGLEWLVHR